MKKSLHNLESIDLIAVSLLEEETPEKMKACTRVGFPICLAKALCRMFGAKSKQTLDSIVKKDKFEKVSIYTANDIWKLYGRYIAGLASALGNDVAEVIEFESLNQMESMFCTNCPLYEMELLKRKISGKNQAF